MNPSKRQGAFFGLAAALLFGISPPFAKLLLPESGPMVTAGLLYLGAGLGLLLFEMTGRPLNLDVTEAPVRRADAGLLAGVILTGGMLGPFLMLWGLERLSGVLTSLLLNLEAPFTVLIAILVFREHLVRLELAGVLVIVVGAGILTYRPGAIRGGRLWDSCRARSLSLLGARQQSESASLASRSTGGHAHEDPRRRSWDAWPCGSHQPAVAIIHDSIDNPSFGTCQLWGEFGAGHARAPAARRGA